MSSIVRASSAIRSQALKHPRSTVALVELFCVFSFVLLISGIAVLAKSAQGYTAQRLRYGNNCPYSVYGTSCTYAQEVHETELDYRTFAAGIVFAVLSVLLVIFFRRGGLPWIPWRKTETTINTADVGQVSEMEQVKENITGSGQEIK